MLKLKRWAQAFSRDLLSLYLAACDSRTPRLVRLLVFAWLVIVISPISPFPESLLGGLTELSLVPIGYWIAVRMVPREILSECRQKAGNRLEPWEKKQAITVLAVALVWVACKSLG